MAGRMVAYVSSAGSREIITFDRDLETGRLIRLTDQPAGDNPNGIEMIRPPPAGT
jgi:hypothetical protein